ncbi:beta-propeller fold lactonase family protein [Occallatibacter savannae]|uniref:beta-propeller fold lactonase family protein n=1 Tax=Occallatibacter savannae TaxID=1002691 RepID=UPI000D69F181|nr:beta-propeller fold lactonase family protein [Occallatibacter savannae]
MDASSPNSRIRFGKFEVNLHSGELRKQGYRIRIQPQPLKVLAVLLERPGELVTREELRKRLWPGELYVDFELGLNRSISKLRRALLDDASSPIYIETISTRGYRFIAPVEFVATEIPSDLPASRHNQLEPRDSETIDNSSPEPEVENPGTQTHMNFAAPHPWLAKNRVVRGLLALLCILAAAGLSLRLWSNANRKALRHRVGHVETRRFVYVADYSGNSILGYTVDPSSGVLSPVPSGPFKSGEHPAALAMIDNYVYSANRGRSDEACGGGCDVSAYVIDSLNGGLVQLDGSPFPAGKGALTVLGHPSGKFLYVVNVISGDLQGYSRSQDGRLQILGAPISLGRHPIDAALSPSGRFLYVSTQDDAIISAFKLGDDGVPRAVPGSPFATGLRPRAIAIDPTERHLYVLNYGVNPHLDRREACIGEYAGIKGVGCTISAFSISQTGALSEISGSPFPSDGINPHGSVIDSAGKYLYVANITSNDVSVFRINRSTGALHPVDGSPFRAGEGPNALTLDWSDLYLYVLNAFSRNVTQFSIDDDGRLTQMSHSVPAGLGPSAIVAIRKADK